MGPIAKAVTTAVSYDDDGWFWHFACDRLSTIHRRQAWPTNWQDDAEMRLSVRYSYEPDVRNAMRIAEAA